MFCKYCGMESETTDRCSWCHRPLITTQTGPAPPPASGVAPTRPASPSPVEADELHHEQAYPAEESPLVSGMVPGPPSSTVPNTPWTPPVESEAPPPTAYPSAPATPDAQRVPGRPIIGVRGRPGAPGQQMPPPTTSPSANPAIRPSAPGSTGPSSPAQRPTIGVRGPSTARPTPPASVVPPANRPPAPS